MLYRLINLDRHPDRLAAFHATHPDMTFERHAGVDGDTVDRHMLIEQNVLSRTLSYNNPALGRALSHLMQWRDAATMGNAVTVIEDTAVLSANFVEEAGRVVGGLPTDWDIILWGHDRASVLIEEAAGNLAPMRSADGCGGARPPEAFAAQSVTTRAARLHAGTGAVAYSVSPKGASRLLDALVPLRPMEVSDWARDRTMVNDRIDVMLARLWPSISAWISVPPLAVSRSGETASTMSAGVAGATTSRSVVSFGLFDTLVARRCVVPREVFRSMAAKLGVPGFEQARMDAEQEMADGQFNLRDIYRVAAATLDLTEDKAAAMMNLEIETELDNMIPIQQVVSTVRPQDIVVCDSYLSHGILLKVLRDKLGLAHNRLFVTCNGKATGTIWPELLRFYDIDLHVGDDPVTDVRSPHASGILTQKTVLSPLSTAERVVDGAGMPALARAMREARLTAVCRDADERLLKHAQSQVNLPLLVMVCLDLIEQVRAHGYQRVLLSGRSCHKLSHLLPEMFLRARVECDVVNFQSSRLLRCQGSPIYTHYFNTLRQNWHPTLVVDLCGSGRSLRRLLATAGGELRETDVYIVHHCPEPLPGTHYELLSGEEMPHVTAMITGGDFDRDTLDLLNAAEPPMPERMGMVLGQILPVYLDGGYEREVREVVAVQQAEFARCVQILFAHRDPGMTSSPAGLHGAAKAIYAELGSFHAAPLRKIFDARAREDDIVVRRLRDLSGSHFPAAVTRGAGRDQAFAR